MALCCMRDSQHFCSSANLKGTLPEKFVTSTSRPPITRFAMHMQYDVDEKMWIGSVKQKDIMLIEPMREYVMLLQTMRLDLREEVDYGCKEDDAHERTITRKLPLFHQSSMQLQWLYESSKLTLKMKTTMRTPQCFYVVVLVMNRKHIVSGAGKLSFDFSKLLENEYDEYIKFILHFLNNINEMKAYKEFVDSTLFEYFNDPYLRPADAKILPIEALLNRICQMSDSNAKHLIEMALEHLDRDRLIRALIAHDVVFEKLRSGTFDGVIVNAIVSWLKVHLPYKCPEYRSMWRKDKWGTKFAVEAQIKRFLAPIVALTEQKRVFKPGFETELWQIVSEPKYVPWRAGHIQTEVRKG